MGRTTQRVLVGLAAVAALAVIVAVLPTGGRGAGSSVDTSTAQQQVAVLGHHLPGSAPGRPARTVTVAALPPTSSHVTTDGTLDGPGTPLDATSTSGLSSTATTPSSPTSSPPTPSSAPSPAATSRPATGTARSATTGSVRAALSPTTARTQSSRKAGITTPPPTIAAGASTPPPSARRPPASTPPAAPSSSPPARTPRPAPPNFGIPVALGNATQLITVTASSSSATTGSLRAWQRQRDGSWSVVLGPYPAWLGSQGIGRQSEYVSRTPLGTFTLTRAFGRLADPGTALPYHRTSPDDWWVSDVHSRDYNTLQNCAPGACPFDTSVSEHLYYITPEYDYAVVMDVNTAPIVPGAGSAFFLHVTNHEPTAGCVAIDRANLLKVMRWLQPSAHPRIATGIG